MAISLLLLILFFFSGACSLIYEVVWSRMLTVIFGTTLFATSTVLSAFMAGLALGSFIFGRWIDRIERPLRVFALLEGGIGFFALLFPWILSALGQVYLWIPPDQVGFYGFSFIRFLLCFTILLIPTVLMGATLPVVVKFGVQHLSKLGRGVGILYAVNTLGAVSGVLLATFVLLEWQGLRGSTYIAMGVNFLLAGIAWKSGKERSSQSRNQEKETVSPPYQSSTPAPILALVLTGFGLSGFAALGYEVAWMRLLTVAFSANSHYEFSIILTAFLLGLALGSFICSYFLDARRDLLSLFGGAQLLIGLLGMVSIPVFAALPNLVANAKGASTWLAFEGSVFAIAVLLMLIPTLLLGATFPLVSRIYTRRAQGMGRGVGDVNAINSMGAIGGSFATGFVLIPLVGTESSIELLAGLNLLVGLLVIGLHPTLERHWKPIIGALVATIVALLHIFGPEDVLRQISKPSTPSTELVHYQEGAAGVVTVSKSTDGFRKLMVNGGGQVPSDYASLQLFRLLGHLPLLLHPDPQDVLVVAFGGGIALGSVAQHPLRRIDCVEIVAAVLPAAQQHFGAFNHHILDSLETSNVHITVDDGRNFLLTRPQSYHVITGDATHPTSADSWVLYTRDFYQLCKERLTRDGIMAQWLPLHGLSVTDYKTILRTFQSVFPHATLWLTNDYALIIGSVQEIQLNLDLLEKKLLSEKVQKSLESVDLGDPFSLLSCFLMDEKTLDNYVGAGPLNTDDHPHISFLRSLGFKKPGWRILEDLGAHRMRVFPFIRGIEERSRDAVKRRMEAYFQSREFVLQADILRMQRRGPAAFQAYSKALKLNPEDLTAAFFVRQYGEQIAKQYQQHLHTRPKDAEARWRLGNLYAQIGRMDQAQKAFERTVELTPDFLKAYLSLSYLYAQKGQPDRALSVYRQAEEIAPDTPPAKASMKSAYEKIHRLITAQQP